MPIVSKVNNEEMGLTNNQRFKIVKIGTSNITIKDDIDNKLDIKINAFQKYFLPAYATTCRSSQGMSIGDIIFKLHHF
jgi:hypothetical protein